MALRRSTTLRRTGELPADHDPHPCFDDDVDRLDTPDCGRTGRGNRDSLTSRAALFSKCSDDVADRAPKRARTGSVEFRERSNLGVHFGLRLDSKDNTFGFQRP